MYEGSYKSGGKIGGGRAAVRVNREGAAVTLVLLSYERVKWLVTLDPGSRLERVILGGYRRQAVEGVPADICVIDSFHEGGRQGRTIPCCYAPDSERLRPMLRALTSMTDLEVSSFQGRYSGSVEEPFVVDRIQDDPRLRWAHPQPSTPANLPSLRFKALVIGASMPMRHEVAASFGDFTLKGPIRETLKPLPRDIVALAGDGKGGRFFGLSRHDVFAVDIVKRTATSIDVGFDVPPLSWPQSITHDTRRDRILLTASGYLYAFDVATRKWSVLTEIGHWGDMAVVAYEPRSDAIFMLRGQYRGDDGGTALAIAELNADGAVIRRIPMKARDDVTDHLGTWPHQAAPQMLGVEGYLVILASTGSADPDSAGSTREGASSIVLVDPKTGESWLTARYGQ